MEIIIWNNKNKYFETYRKIANIYRKNFEEKVWKYFDEIEVVYIISWEKCIWWFSLSEEIINPFEEKENLEILEKLKNKNYYNLSYLIIEEKYRWKWLGRDLLTEFFKNTDKLIWLSSQEKRKIFYLSLWLKQVNKKLWEDNYIFVNK